MLILKCLKLFKIWSRRGDLNPRPTDYESYVVFSPNPLFYLF